ncbi:2-dehydro-3-deoxy-D-gluconate 5-dehydrogenase KduD [Sporomusa sp.]|uniref:2-dehydro-3-deoxy-D-gluconate 5-dehydrogenase KduD n=1 Tax=Sporomusa sp. TaxID=2078658 RepID=UPI002B5D49CD|nr:2-dehydro-3-deoxy-D-gluconate 5-dehydrogenase KduD [Sporomusa sp.]HWR45397.1 2-dehydro-3-deoxy-D-gluconate 5-dehydrogenase KduD [Sporomusa sp.]
MMSMFDLTGKVAIVTGAATGLGQGMAIALAEAGADIVSVGLGDHAETAQKIADSGRKFLAIDADLFSTEPIQGVIDQVISEFGHLDILVNNAGIIRRADAVEFTEKDWDDVMNINIKTAFFFSQAAAKQFIKQGTGGKIINIASMLSFQGGIRVPSYTASKSGIMGITRLMANEWAKYNINANAIAPGYMATANTAPLRADEERSAEILGRIPAGRWGTPADLGGPVVFLASSAADYVNGYTVAVDGGWLAR